MRIFLSHSNQDNDWCDVFAEELTRKGADVWYDKRGLYAGAHWIRTLEREIEARNVFIVVLSPDALNSYWVEEEFCLALSLHKAIIGVLIKKTELRGFIKNRQVHNAIGQTGTETARAIWSALVTATSSPALDDDASSNIDIFIPAVPDPITPPRISGGAADRGASPGSTDAYAPRSGKTDLEDVFVGTDPFSLVKSPDPADVLVSSSPGTARDEPWIDPFSEQEDDYEYCTIVHETREELSSLGPDAQYILVEGYKAMKRADGDRILVASEARGPNQTSGEARARLVKRLLQDGWEELPSPDPSQSNTQFQRLRRL